MLKVVKQGIQTRGTTAQRRTKVKGHDTEEDIAEGKSTIAHRSGNNEADTCETMGIREAAKDIERKIVAWLL